MANQQIDLTKLSTVELKAIAYDLNIMLGKTQQNLQKVAKELQNRENVVTTANSEVTSS